MDLSLSTLAATLGVNEAVLQPLAEAMQQFQATEPYEQLGLWATVRTEVGAAMLPLYEKSARGEDPEAYFNAKYGGRKDLGNDQPGDGFAFRGRGYVQLTGRANYTTYGNLLGLDLVRNPDLALDAGTAAAILILFFKRSGASKFALMQDWPNVRRRINGGVNGIDTFMAWLTKLGAA